MNNWWWVQYLCGMAVMRSRKNMHSVHLFFAEIPAVFKRNVFIRKPRYFNIFFLHVFPWLPCSSAIHSSHWIFRMGWWNPVCFKIFYKERLWPSLSASPWSQSCRRTLVVPNACDSPSHWHPCQWSRQFSTQLYKKVSPRLGFIIMIPREHYCFS